MKLAIDPGHGLANLQTGVYDPGSTALGQEEATIALQWALTLKHLATEAGIECWLTRTSRDFAAPLRGRVARARANECTRLISIHCNEATGKARGTETFYRVESRQGEAFAELVQSAAMEGFRSLDGDWRNRGTKDDTQTQHGARGLRILRGGMLACLLELGFQDHEGDLSLLLFTEARVAVCSRIVAALKEID